MQEKPELPVWLRSSVDPTQVARRVSGLAVVFGGLIVWGFAQAGQAVSPDVISATFNDIGTIAGLAATAYGLVQTAYGTILAILMRFR